MTTTFIGIDLAWKSDCNPSGVAVLTGDQSGASLTMVETLRSQESILDFIRNVSSDNTIIAIDAPLIITNETGQRRCETEIGRRYGAREASCHTSNLTLYKDASSVAFTKQLLSAGHSTSSAGPRASSRAQFPRASPFTFAHIDLAKPKQHAKALAEVYPHAAMVALWDLPKTIKYKKGPLAVRCEGLETLRNHLVRLQSAEPPLKQNELMIAELKTNLDALRGQALKDYEDRLDAIFCAYLAYYMWYWGDERNECFGDCDSGYIINPKLQTASKNGLEALLTSTPDAQPPGSSPTVREGSSDNQRILAGSLIRACLPDKKTVRMYKVEAITGEIHESEIRSISLDGPLPTAVASVQLSAAAITLREMWRQDSDRAWVASKTAHSFRLHQLTRLSEVLPVAPTPGAISFEYQRVY